MANRIVLKSYARALEKTIPPDEIKHNDVDSIAGKPMYHLFSTSATELSETTIGEIGYARPYCTIEGHELCSPDQVRAELTDLVIATIRFLR